MVDSKEFAVGIFDALARRRRQNLERISKDELYEFWLQISDQSFDARLQIFFDMCAHNPALISSSVFLSQLVLCSFACLCSWPETNPFRFRVDTNVDGRITREEVQEVIKSS
jgi:hypothetical protein